MGGGWNNSRTRNNGAEIAGLFGVNLLMKMKERLISGCIYTGGLFSQEARPYLAIGPSLSCAVC